MSALLSFPWILGALTAASPSPSPGSTPAPDHPSKEELIRGAIHDITPPVDVFPYPTWLIVTVAVIAAILLGLILWGLVALLRRRPGGPPPTPYEIAFRELQHLREKAGETEPYTFSVAVSDVLRTFIGNAKFKLPAIRQTSPEFLAAISSSKFFTESDRSLLSHFLEKCDLIKFARINATSADNTELVESALAFVRGGES